MERYGSVIKVKPEKLEEYKKLHANVWPGVAETIKECNIATMYVTEGGLILTEMAEKMKKDSSRKIYGERKIVVEPVFGQIKTGGFKRFSLRGLEKAGGEFSLVCAVSNFKKIVKKMKKGISIAKKGELETAVA